MSNIKEDVNLKYSVGTGNTIVEILSIGFEPLLWNDEYELNKEIFKCEKNKQDYQMLISFVKSKKMDNSWISFFEEKIKSNEKYKKDVKSELKKVFVKNADRVRYIHTERQYNKKQYKNITIAESELTRCVGCEDMSHCYDIVGITTYYTEVFRSLMFNGFLYNSKKYVFYTAGAGQTRNKKSTFLLEDTLKKNEKRLFCGLTREIINNKEGMNTNKFLAYTSLTQSNTEIWKEFDIDKSIVVDDIEFELLNQTVRLMLYNKNCHPILKDFDI